MMKPKVVATTGAIKHAKLQSNYHHQHTNTQHARCPSCCQTNSARALKGKVSHSTPSSPGDLQPPGYIGECCQASHQSSDASPQSTHNLGINPILGATCCNIFIPQTFHYCPGFPPGKMAGHFSDVYDILLCGPPP